MTPQALSGDANYLCYGDNIDVLRRMVRDDTVDLCYIDPPFNSKRDYNQIYNNVGVEDRAQAQAFTDTWTWDDRASEGFDEIRGNNNGLFRPQLVDLLVGLSSVLGRGSLLAYLVSISLRVTEIRRVLAPNGTFYLHCDPTSSHYLKLVLDAVFCSGDRGDFRNEIIWAYESGGRSKRDFGSKHDVIFRYTKSNKWKFNADEILLSREKTRHNHMKRNVDDDGRVYYSIKSAGKIYRYYADEGVIPSDVWTDCSHLQQKDPERLGYPTQKPESLLERIVKASSDEGDMVMDAYCGCGTTVAVAQRLKRRWIGIDITYQSISLVLKRLEDRFGKDVLKGVVLDGVPRDIASAEALANKRDDRLRKEFEKWAVLTYTNNRAVINDKKGADAGIDGRAYFWKTKEDTDKAVFQVKSGNVARGDIAKLKGDMQRENAAIGVLITLDEPSQPMRAEAKGAGRYTDVFTGRTADRVQIVTIRDILEHNKRFDLPLTAEVLTAAKPAATDKPQTEFDLETGFVSAKKTKMAKASLPLGFKEEKRKRKRRA